jgi:osmotically-inducible protein OsmY
VTQEQAINNVSPAQPDSTHQPMMPPTIPMQQRYLVTPGVAVSSSDLELAERIRTELNNDPALPAGRRVDATVKDSVVWLRGTVPTDQDRQNIANHVAAIPGVARVENALGADMP